MLVERLYITCTSHTPPPVPQLQWDCINPDKMKKKKYKNSGTVYLQSIKV